MIRLSAVVVAFLLCAPASMAAEPAPASAVVSPELKGIIDAVEARYAKVNTIKAGFTQIKKDAFGEVKQDGDVVLQRPTKMRWRFTSGDESSFVTDGSTLWIYTKADNQVLRISDTSQATSTANTFLTSLDSLDELFTITLVDNSDGPTLEMVPRTEGMYTSIRLSLDAKYTLKQVIFNDTYGNVTDLAFRDVKLNESVDAKVFVFEPPAGATVIDN
ncbi:MAG: outer membrane lipoprotein chaperone LolA [Myxococcota bacterium]